MEEPLVGGRDWSYRGKRGPVVFHCGAGNRRGPGLGWSPLTYKGFLVILRPQAIASWEEGVSISLIEPWQIPEVETQAHLWRQLLKGLWRTQRVLRGSPTCSICPEAQEDPLARPDLISIHFQVCPAEKASTHPFPSIKAYSTQEALTVHTIV